MYETFYGFSAKPFQLNPDPSFFFGSKQHTRAMSYLEYGLHKNEGFIVITGEVGAGKTTVLRSLLEKIDPTQVVAVQLVSTHLNADDTLRMVGAAFGVRVADVSKSEMLLAIEAYLLELSIQGRRALLIVDEAQNLSMQAMEELRMLSNYQIDNQALLQSFLVGQPEFRAILESPRMEQLRQRVIAACHISPMDADETKAYVRHRLKHVGWTGTPHFEAEAYEVLFQATDGVPRRINAVCDRLLLAGFLAQKTVFKGEDVHQAATEIRSETRFDRPVPRGVEGNEADVAPNFEELGFGEGAIDATKFKFTPEVAMHVSDTVDRLRASDFEERLARLERMSATTMSVLKHLLDAVRAHHHDDKDSK